MANTSILAAFERMWQHIVAALSSKADSDHPHTEATQDAAGFLSAEDKIQLDYGGTPIVTTAGTGSATVLNGVTPVTSAALTGLGTPTTATVLKGVKVSTQPTVTLKLVDEAAGDIDIVTGVSAGTLSAQTTAGTNDVVNAVTGVSASASAVTLASQVVTEVTAGTTDQTVDVAIPALTVNVSGAIGIPQ